jgi:acetolactate synthase I/II/III large subunit
LVVSVRDGRVVDYIVEQLCAAGVRHLFAVDGANIEDLFDAAHLRRRDITAVLAKHEFSAAAMADGYSRCGARLGVVAATSGGGCLNLVPGLGESLASRVPVLALVGQAPTPLDGRGSFQDTSGRNGSLDAEALFGAVSVYCRRVLSPGQIVEVLPQAIDAAQTGGPAVLLLPKDVQQAVVAGKGAGTVQRHHLRRRRAGEARLDHRSPIVTELLSARGAVTIVAGEQVARDDAREELERLRIALHARVACVPDAKDVAAAPGTGARASLGVIGIMGHPATLDALRDSAVCLLVGTRMPLTGRAGLEDVLGETAILSIGSAQPYLPCTHVHSDDLRKSLVFLAQAVACSGRLEEPVAAPRSELVPPADDGPGVGYRDVMKILDELLPDSADIAVDAGNTGAAAIHHLPHRRNGRFVVALGMGGMGYSFGAGIGVAFARGHRTVVIAGDGAFFMHGLELHTAVEHRLPVTFVLLNNNAHAMCVTREQLYYGDRYSYNRFGPSRLGAGLAAMFPGLYSAEVDDADRLRDVLTEALGQPGPSVVSIECSADEIPPFVPFLAALEAARCPTVRPTSEENHINVPASA